MLYFIIQETDFKSDELLVSLVFCPLNPPKGGLGSMIIYLILNVLASPLGEVGRGKTSGIQR
jgi:hypothetical protein